MCLITKQSKPLYTKEDIIVYKELEKRGGRLFSRYYWSLFEYIPNKLYSTEIRNSMDFSFFDTFAEMKYKNCDTPLYSYGAGFHSALSCSRLINYSPIGSSPCIVECIIPNGSAYYKDDTGLIVSNKIIITKILNKNERY